jgi:NAD(P)-dependent dehydrogenase (short-subunit alcohol dehydrogenase family)
MSELENRVAIVTGASGDIGRAIAVELAARGAHVVATGRDSRRLEETVGTIRAAGGSGSQVVADLTNEEDFSRIVEAARSISGNVDILVNNAGVSPMGSVLDISPADWARCLTTNLTSVYLACRAVIPHMQASGGGSIVNIAGTLGLTAMPSKAAYCAAKAGVVNLTRQMALDFGGDNIRVNAVCPGFIDTRLNDGLSGEDRSFFLQKLPIASAGTPADVAGMAAFLCGEGGRYITGAAIPVDGGQIAGLRD